MAIGTASLSLDKLRDFVLEKERQGLPVRRFAGGTAGLPPEWQAQAGQGAATLGGIVLREDTFVELGSPRVGGCSFVVWTADPSRVDDGRVTLIGPDIPEGEGESLPFGQVLLVAGKDLTDQYHLQLQESQYRAAESIPGYMVRAVPGRLWVRVSKDSWRSGLCFDAIGKHLVQGVKRMFPAVTSAEVLFVTSSRDDVESLESVGAEVEKLSRWLRKQKVTGLGDYECTSSSGCDSCEERIVCDTTSEVIAIRGRSMKRPAKAKHGNADSE